MAVQLAWNLDQTSSSAISVAKGLLSAATTDNVQPIAIMACEQFGNTLAISRDTIRKIEHCVAPSPDPAVLNFLKCSVGYKKNDCTSYLGKSLAGLQFLAFAAALVTWKDQFQAAGALHEMLINTASDKALVPTSRQVKVLLATIEPRCHRSSFADEIIGWQILLDRLLTPRIEPATERSDGWIAPGEKDLGNLVDALRQLSRVGNADITRVTIETRACAAWTIAFVKWSLGYPPSVVHGNTIVPSLEQTDSKVTVIIPADKTSETSFRVHIYHSIDTPTVLVSQGPFQTVSGMISLQMYGSKYISECGLDSGPTGTAFREVIPHCLQRAVEYTTRICIEQRTADPLKQPMRLSRPYINGKRLSPLRGIKAVYKTYENLFGHALDPAPNDPNFNIEDFPQLALIKQKCPCGHCRNVRRIEPVTCDILQFHRSLDAITFDLLALSLFDYPDLQVCSDATRDFLLDPLYEGILDDLKNPKKTERVIYDLLSRAMCIAGHKIDQVEEDWVLSCAKGQAVWPTIFETQSYITRGYFSLSCHPGLLIHSGETYNRATCSPNETTMTSLSTVLPEQVKKPFNLYPNLDLDWMVSDGEHGLDVSLGVKAGPNQYLEMGLSPCSAFVALTRIPVLAFSSSEIMGISLEDLAPAVPVNGTGLKIPPPPILDVLERFTGTFQGFGFNTIFRPLSRNPKTVTKFLKTLTDLDTTRLLPQDLSQFIVNWTITQEIIDDPNTILRQANEGKDIIEDAMFIVSTNAPPRAFGGGTSNNGFNIGSDEGKKTDALREKKSGNANAVDVSAQFWVSKIRAEAEPNPSMRVGQKVSPASQGPRDAVPEFYIDKEVEIPSCKKTVTVAYTQIQYSQMVMLDFNGIKWPYVTVATFAPIIDRNKLTHASAMDYVKSSSI
ncbi:hypothetical protein FOYG_13020 [Fusarium oxysporum NRRL 32931]|uniref:Uncharacterized protein n=1 Tax=Fusarium oxysporum NRRL 32931 TaxID=660029 RepID=W9HSF6_FUSOX|nr:hypothetical protein FOYG_13020 [Fusarium oxysporum NRRL 32931]